MSVAKLAERIDVPARTITAYERGERQPSMEFLAHMCTILNLNANWFVTGKGEMFNKETPCFNELKEELLLEVRQMLKNEGVLK